MKKIYTNLVLSLFTLLLFSPELGNFRIQVEKAIDWLVKAVESDCHRIDSPIGFYFAKLWYHERLYPQIFTVAALGRSLAKYGSLKE